MLDTIHLYSAVCQIYLNETEKRQNFFKPNTKKQTKESPGELLMVCTTN